MAQINGHMDFTSDLQAEVVSELCVDWARDFQPSLCSSWKLLTEYYYFHHEVDSVIPTSSSMFRFICCPIALQPASHTAKILLIKMY